MSGHSRWSQIKRQKSITDQKKGQLFSKLSKVITMAAKKGSNPETNLELKTAIEKARSFNMPNDNIERAIKKLSDKNTQLSEVLIDAIGPGGIALRIKAITDNSNRTVQEIKTILSENNSKMVPPGSISWMFNNSASVSDEQSSQLDKLFEQLDNQDDVEDVSSNLQ